MDKLDIILQKLEKLETGQKEIKSSQDKMESDILSLKSDNKTIHRKLDLLMATIAETKEEMYGMKVK